ncbi:glutamyl aminopeptidase [Parasteatoda tepidariorum]|uniref:glutamyl aminopeptidase n=1 Tax=Parasteatoda tepidariorum TaxID=114398 RepID=UPI00077F9336|nr:glutamyl aminopeptidase [Parasteatoda tepidariorum]
MLSNFINKSFYNTFVIGIVLLFTDYFPTIASSRDESHIWEMKESTDSFRLPRSIVPIHYDIVFNPRIKSDKFNGDVNITVSVIRPTNYFTVHERGLEISISEVYDIEQRKMLNIKRRFKSGMDSYIIETMDEIRTGKYILIFEFNGIYEHGVGLYREEYDYSKNDKRHLAMTFFAPNYARRAFPCFDEPSFKATFSIGVFHDSTHFAISNMPVALEMGLENNRKLTKFEKTPLMSTYLLCIIVCDFQYKETLTDNGIKIRAYASQDTVDKIEAALNWTSKILTYFENYLNVSYPLKKLDIISLPEFDANGMENWGLITYKEQSLLVDNTSSMTHKLKVAILVAHEVAHMWFGNLVTMDWWNETWLNEGFATHFAWKGAKHVLPEYFMVDDSGILDACNVMKQDESIHTRPVIRTVTEVMYSDVYSIIVYKKGASLLRMLEKYITEENFIKGISKYLTKHAYGNAETEYLWLEINEFTIEQGINVSRLMHSWLTASNFPYINVSCRKRNSCQCNLFQNRFLLDPLSKESTQNQSHQRFIWDVPLSYTTSESNAVEYILFDSKQKAFPCNQTKWIKFNSQYSGYYLVKYSERDWKQFIRILARNLTVFNKTDRLNLLFDAFTLASHGKINYSIPLNLSRYLKKEDYHSVWSVYHEFMSTIKGYLSDDKNGTTALKIYTRKLAKQLYSKYRWNNEGNFLEKNLRRELIKAICGNNGRVCMETAADAYKKWMIGEMPNPEFAELVYKCGLSKLNDEVSFNHMWNKYLNESNPLLKEQYRDALSHVGNSSVLKRLLTDCMDRRYFRLSWQVPMIKSIAGNSKGFSLVSSYIINKWNDLVRKYGEEQSENLAEFVFSKYQTEKDLLLVQEFYETHPSTEKNMKARTRTLDNIKRRINWKLKYQAEVTEWFYINSKP